MIAAVATLAGVLVASTVFAGVSRRAFSGRAAQLGAVQQFIQWLDPPAIHVAGTICVPAPPFPAPLVPAPPVIVPLTGADTADDQVSEVQP